MKPIYGWILASVCGSAFGLGAGLYLINTGARPISPPKCSFEPTDLVHVEDWDHQTMVERKPRPDGMHDFTIKVVLKPDEYMGCRFYVPRQSEMR